MNNLVLKLNISSIDTPKTCNICGMFNKYFKQESTALLLHLKS